MADCWTLRGPTFLWCVARAQCDTPLTFRSSCQEAEQSLACTQTCLKRASPALAADKVLGFWDVRGMEAGCHLGNAGIAL